VLSIYIIYLYLRKSKRFIHCKRIQQSDRKRKGEERRGKERRGKKYDREMKKDLDCMCDCSALFKSLLLRRCYVVVTSLESLSVCPMLQRTNLDISTTSFQVATPHTQTSVLPLCLYAIARLHIIHC